MIPFKLRALVNAPDVLSLNSELHFHVQFSVSIRIEMGPIPAIHWMHFHHYQSVQLVISDDHLW